MESDPAGFPETQWSVIAQRGFSDSVQREHLDVFMRTYWKPIFWQLRRFHSASNEDARDLTQGFMCEVVERDLVAKFDPARSRLRTYLKAALRVFVAEYHRSQRRLKRGGEVTFVDVARFDPPAPAVRENETPDACFDRQWKLELLAHGVRDLEERLRRENRATRWEVFRRIELSQETYDAVGAALGLTRRQVKWELSEAKGQLQLLVRDSLRETVATQGDFEDELSTMGW